jgi:PIN domain nuclease of toxin-antitoxin system
MSDSLLLDTCALLWLAEGSKRFGRTLKSRIDSARTVFVSAISAWEISLKHSKGDLMLPMEPEEWFAAVMNEQNLELIPLSPEILMAANRLPWHHRDPADRFIIASAQAKRVSVVTADDRFSLYPIRVLTC